MPMLEKGRADDKAFSGGSVARRRHEKRPGWLLTHSVPQDMQKTPCRAILGRELLCLGILSQQARISRKAPVGIPTDVFSCRRNPSPRFVRSLNGQPISKLPRADLTPTVNGVPNVKSWPSVSFPQILPTPVGELDFNCRPDPDCNTFGASPDLGVQRVLGRKASARNDTVLLSNSSAMGLGAHKLCSSAPKDLRRVSTAFEYDGDPQTWVDGREIRCHAVRTIGPCHSGICVLSNDHLLDEIDRLRRSNGVLDGPACGACGRLYLEVRLMHQRPAQERHQERLARPLRVPDCPAVPVALRGG